MGKCGTILDSSTNQNMLTVSKKEDTFESNMLDTYGIYSRLKRARASDAVSREIAMIFGQMVEGKLATKQDLAVLEKDLKTEIAASRAETLRWIVGMMIAQTGLLFAAIKALT
ncbi:MAG: hypothetical protein K8S54_03805 [Spirochaetia bacterium]|nr:hypothetical protein [Spirochaetia bacterium]